MTILCLTGWHQPADALSAIAPDATHFEYAAYDNAQAMFDALPKAPKLAIGWSLGGQLLVRAVAVGHVRPQALLLLGVPFQWVADEHFPEGVTAETADGARAEYAREPGAMVKNLTTLLALGDAQEKSIVRALNASPAVWKNGAYWLEQLATASCLNLDFTVFPPTHIIHGAQDKVVAPANAEAFAHRLPQAKLELWETCAHVPHLHDAAKLREIVSGYV